MNKYDDDRRSKAAWRRSATSRRNEGSDPAEALPIEKMTPVRTPSTISAFMTALTAISLATWLCTSVRVRGGRGLSSGFLSFRLSFDWALLPDKTLADLDEVDLVPVAWGARAFSSSTSAGAVVTDEDPDG